MKRLLIAMRAGSALLAVACAARAGAEEQDTRVVTRVSPKSSSCSAVFGGEKTRRRYRVVDPGGEASRLAWSLVAEGRVLSRGELGLDQRTKDVQSVDIEVAFPKVREGVVLDTTLTVKLLDANRKRVLAQDQRKVYVFGRNPFAQQKHWLKSLDIRLYDPLGDTAAALSAQKVPFKRVRSADALAGVRQGLVVLGDLERGWCAMLELDQQGKPSVRVFHEARQVVRIDGKGNEFAKDPASAFSPAWLHHYDDGTDDPKVLVGRRSLLQSKGLPLLINLRTLKASVDARALVGMPAEPANPFSFHSRGGHLLQCGGASVLHFAPGTRFPKKICLATTQRIGPYVTHNLRRRIIPSNDGWLYVPGYAWFRIHAETYEVQRLNQGMLPQPFRNVTWGTSSHYGLVGWLWQRPANAQAPVRIYDVTIAAKKK